MAYVRYQTSGQGYRQDSRCVGPYFDKLRAYSDESVFIFSETDGIPHNTITPIARMHKDLYELDLVTLEIISLHKRVHGGISSFSGSSLYQERKISV